MSIYKSKALALALTLILLEVTLPGIGVYSTESGLEDPPPAVIPLRIGIEPRNISIRQGESGNLTVTVTALPYETEMAITSETAVFLHANLNPYYGAGIMPEGVTATLDPPSVTPQPRGAANSTLTLRVDSATPPDTYFLSVEGAWSWGEDRTTVVGSSFYLTIHGDNPPTQRPLHDLRVSIFISPGVYLGTPTTVRAYSENYIVVMVWNTGSSREEGVTVRVFMDGGLLQEETLSLAGYPETYDTHSLLDTYSTVSKKWVPTAQKTHDITAIVFNPHAQSENSLVVNVIEGPAPILTTLPHIVLALLLGGGALAIIWLILSRRRTNAKIAHN